MLPMRLPFFFRKIQQMQPPNATDRNSSLQSEFHPSRVIFHPAPSFPRHPHVIMPPLRLHHHLERRLLNVSFPRMFQLSNVRRNLKIFQESYINQAGIVKRRKKFQKVQSPLRTCSFFNVRTFNRCVQSKSETSFLKNIQLRERSAKISRSN